MFDTLTGGVTRQQIKSEFDFTKPMAAMRSSNYYFIAESKGFVALHAIDLNSLGKNTMFKLPGKESWGGVDIIRPSKKGMLLVDASNALNVTHVGIEQE